MPILKDDVVEVLSDLRLRNIRFTAGPVHVNSTEYDKVADYIKSGAVTVQPIGGKFSLYVPQANTLKTRDGDPKTDVNARTNVLHECTHIISDMNKVSITRLEDEAIAYIAQIAYLLLINPGEPEPPIGGSPLMAITRMAMQLVKKYKLGKSEGIGAVVDHGDISNLANLVQHDPEYAKFSKTAMLAADGVGMSKNQSEEFYRLQLSRLASKLLDDLMAEEVANIVTLKVRYVANENYVTWDPELLELLDIFKRGPESKKKASLQRLVRIFLTINQASATDLSQRLSASKKGDVVSERFHREVPSQLRTELLAALRLSR